jgi:hypothetical protein
MHAVRGAYMFKGAVGLLLALTIGWKIAVGMAPRLAETNSFRPSLTEFLNRHHFSVAESDNVIEGIPLLVGTRENCRLSAAAMDFRGSRTRWIQDFANLDDQVFFVFRGAVYERPPTWLSAADHYWSRLAREMGFDRLNTPLVAIIAPPKCGAKGLSWGELLRRD